MGILKNDTKTSSQICFLYLVDVDAVITDFSVLNIIKTVNQVGDSCLSCTGTSDEGKLLSRSCKHLDIMQYNLFIRITEVNTLKFYIAFQLHKFQLAGFLIDSLPCPFFGTFFTFHKFSLCIFLHIDQCNRSLVGLRLFIEQIEDSFRTCHRHNHTV